MAPPPGAVIAATRPGLAVTARADAAAALLGQLDPRATFVAEARVRVEAPPERADLWERPDPLAPVTVVPSFPRPMYEPLRDRFQDLLLPGLDRIPHNSIALLRTNARFIESYMVGLNHELSRELLWREYPTALWGTYFRQFWGAGDGLAPAGEGGREVPGDMPPIAGWRGALGGNLPPDRGGKLLMLLIKGDLLARYPTALIYAARAKWPDGAGGGTRPVVDEARPPDLPVLRVTPAPGVTLLGFALPETVPAGDPGWFFVIEEHPTEPRFGLDLSGGAPTTWRELSWPLAPTRADGSGHITLTPAPALADPDPTEVKSPKQIERERRDRAVVWGRDAAHMAYIMLQKPYRLQIHARVWLP